MLNFYGRPGKEKLYSRRKTCAVFGDPMHNSYPLSDVKVRFPPLPFSGGGGGVGVWGSGWGVGWGVATSLPEFSITDTWNCERVKA